MEHQSYEDMCDHDFHIDFGFDYGHGYETGVVSERCYKCNLSIIVHQWHRKISVWKRFIGFLNSIL